MSADHVTRTRGRFALVVSVLAALVVLALGATVLHLWLRDPPTGRAQPTQPQTTSTATADRDVQWVRILGVRLPVSRLHGPRTTTATTASGFSDSEFGAALAAVHILIRAGAAAGPGTYEPTITQQVLGVNAAAMKLLAHQEYQQMRVQKNVADGQPVEGDAEVLGYRVGSYDAMAGTATIEVLLTSPSLRPKGQLVQIDVALQRADGDWKVIAPPRGDWASATKTLATEPEGLLPYDESS